MRLFRFRPSVLFLAARGIWSGALGQLQIILVDEIAGLLLKSLLDSTVMPASILVYKVRSTILWGPQGRAAHPPGYVSPRGPASTCKNRKTMSEN